MANIVLKTYAAGDNNQGSVTPQNDALIYQAAVPVNGLFFGGAITLSSANVLHVAAGMGIIGGRFFEVLESDISVQLSASGDLLGRLYIHLDLSNADNPIEINAVTGASLPALQGDPDLNISNGVFDMELCTFSINELTISNIVQTFPTITAVNNQIRRATAYSANDFVLCQSASGALIFICTTAGTTAVQEPTAYASVASGSNVTDGTAVFKAYNLYSWIEGKAPKSHASTGTTYGIGTTTKYGHCMTINGLTQASHADGKALSAYQGKVLNDNKAPNNHASSATTYGVGTTANYGHNKIIDDLTKTALTNGESLSAHQGNVLGSLIAPIESNASSASKTYAIGEQFILNGLLSEATAAITQGSAFVLDGNYKLSDSITKQMSNIFMGSAESITLPYTTKKAGFLMIYINPSSVAGGTVHIRVNRSDGSTLASALSSGNGEANSSWVPIPKGATISQNYINNASASYIFYPLFN